MLSHHGQCPGSARDFPQEVEPPGDIIEMIRTVITVAELESTWQQPLETQGFIFPMFS